MATDFDVIVIGAGVIGTSVAHSLAKRRVGRIGVLEQSTLAAGATGKSSGVLRCHYGIPIVAAMAHQGLQWFRQVRQSYGLDVGYRDIGYVVGVGPHDVGALRANVAMQQKLGIHTELLSPDDAQSLWPEMEMADFSLMAYEPDGGVADPTLTATAFYRLSKQFGVTYMFDQRVRQLQTHSGKVTGILTADGQGWSAGAVVIAAGTDTPALCDPLGITVPIRSQRAQLIVVNPGQLMPNRPVFSDLIALQYGRPEVNGTILVGNSDHRAPEWVSEGPCPDGVTEDHIQLAIEKFMRRFPQWDTAQLLGGYSGCYEVTPDYNPVIGLTPVDGLYIAAGFSGHGFKLSPVVGDMVADLLVNHDDRNLDSYAFRLRRFEEQQLLVSQHPYGGAGQMR